MAKISSTDLDVYPVALGGNVFGWTANEEESFAVLDGYAAAGGNFIDTADVYSAWAPGNSGGESETILGHWMASRARRDQTIIATKVGKHPQFQGLSAKTIRAAAENSLQRLDTDYIDLYYAHADDEQTPLEESLGAFDALVREGKVRYIAASNYTAPRLSEALEVSDREGLARYVALQQHYNLMERHQYEGELEELVARERLSSIPYFALASGFLTGKYRPGAKIQSQRAQSAGSYLNEKGIKVLAALDEVAAAHHVADATIALAWLSAQPTVVAPIASARTPEQLPDLLHVQDVRLSEAEMRKLNEASAPAGNDESSS
ncbi:MAG: aldo/keto reductase [Verrucomicrobia bacterium]|nr:aldo/keto reductase [Verrucomicrobiota bacterium]